MDVSALRHAYRRWAPVYDFTFGQIAEAGRKHAVKIINSRRGRVLEVGVGTGLSLSCYGDHLTLTGIDLSPEMLDKAREKVERRGLDNVAGLYEMDAGALAFADESFDTVVAMYVMTVVPEPERVMRELERVCAAGGEVILVNHFSQEEGVRGWFERRLAAAPVITVPAITLEGDANGAPHPDASSYASKFSGRYEHRNIQAGVGHNLPQEAPRAFAQAVVDVDGY